MQLKIALETQSKLHIQSLVKDKKLELVASYMLRYERSKNPFEMCWNTIFDFMRENAFGYVGDERHEIVEAKAAEILNRGMKCLIEQMGIVEAEHFVSTIIREKFDYTKWQREYFDAKTPEEISTEASHFENYSPLSVMR